MAPLDRDHDVLAAWTAQWQEAQRMWSDWWQRSIAQPLPAASTPAELPSDVAAVNARFQRGLAALWQAAVATPANGQLPEVVEQAPSDRRFAANAWREQPFFSLLRQRYLLYAGYVRELASLAPLPDVDKRRLVFAT